MAFRFRKRIKLMPGLHLNISKSGVSASVGRRGASMTVGKTGTRANLGVPGTGLSYSTKLGGGGAKKRKKAETDVFAQSVPSRPSSLSNVSLNEAVSDPHRVVVPSPAMSEGVSPTPGLAPWSGSGGEEPTGREEPSSGFLASVFLSFLQTCTLAAFGFLIWMLAFRFLSQWFFGPS